MKIIIDEEVFGNNTLLFGDAGSDVTSTIFIYPESKTFQSKLCVSGYEDEEDTEKLEYRIKTDPIKVEARLVGVVLESRTLKRMCDFDVAKNYFEVLKEEREWHETVLPISMYILSKHPEIISAEDYKNYLRQMSEKIKNATLKIKKALESDEMGLKVTDDEYGGGRTIWCSTSKQDTMSKDETKKAIEWQKKLQEHFFDKKSKEYVGISEDEFRESVGTLETIEVFLNKKNISNKNKTTTRKNFLTKRTIISLLLTLFISWVMSWFVDINPFLIFILVQVITFAQAIELTP